MDAGQPNTGHTSAASLLDALFQADEHLHSSLPSLAAIQDVLKGLQPPSAHVTQQPSSTDSHPGPETFARFQIERELGTGGFGWVFLARDPRLNRLVALKVPRPDRLATVEMQRLLIAEAEAAALLDHPNIVPVFEAGEVGPLVYIASAYCPGPTLAQWLKEHEGHVSPRQAALIAERLAAATSHAHQRGVLHRDIKPSNIILQEVGDSHGGDELPFLPRLTDFGLAQRVGTEAQQSGPIGTPRYMAPEQESGGPITVRADIYGLGAVLEEMLYGPRLYDSPPVRPDRRTGARRTHVPSDLAAICQRCLMVDPDLRYPSAEALRDDLQRFLAGMPVSALPRPVHVRLARWCVRHPAVTSATILAVLSLVGGLAGVTWQWRTAQRSYLSEQRAMQQAQLAIDHYVQVVLDNDLLQDQRLQPLRRRLLADALEYYRALVVEYEHMPGNRRDLAKAFHQLALISNESGATADAESALHEATRIFRSMIERSQATREDRVMFSDALRRLGRIQRSGRDLLLALATFEEAIGALSPLSNDDHDSRAMASLAAIHLDVAALHHEAGNPQRCHAALEQATALGETLVAKHPEQPDFPNELARAYGNGAGYLLSSGKIADAKRYSQRAIELCQALIAQYSDRPADQMELIRSYLRAGDVERDTGRVIQALNYYNKALQVSERLLAGHPNLIDSQYLCAQTCHTLGSALLRGNAFGIARGHLKRALELREQLALAQPDVLDFQGDVAATCHVLAELPSQPSEPGKAREYLTRAIAIRESLVAENASREQWRNGLARSYAALATVCVEDGDFSQAQSLLEQAIDMHTTLSETNPTANLHRAHAGHTWYQLGLLHYQQARFAEASRAFRQALEWQAPLADANPQILIYRDALNKTRRHLIATMLVQTL